MFRAARTAEKFYAVQIELTHDIDNIEEFLNSGDITILCNRLEDLEGYRIGTDEIKIVK